MVIWISLESTNALPYVSLEQLGSFMQVSVTLIMPFVPLHSYQRSAEPEVSFSSAASQHQSQQ